MQISKRYILGFVGMASLAAIFTVGPDSTVKANQLDAKEEKSAQGALRSMIANLSSHNGGDWEQVADARYDDATVFGAGGGLLVRHSRDQLREAFDDGFGSDLRSEHVEVKLHGDVAIITGYYVGKWMLEDGSVVEGNWRFSEVRVWDRSRWRISHTHLSDLSPPTTIFDQ